MIQLYYLNIGLTYHSQILAHMFSLLENNSIQIPLAPQVQNPAQNVEFVSQHVFTLLKTAYPHLAESVDYIIKYFDLFIYLNKSNL